MCFHFSFYSPNNQKYGKRLLSSNKVKLILASAPCFSSTSHPYCYLYFTILVSCLNAGGQFVQRKNYSVVFHLHEKKYIIPPSAFCLVKSFTQYLHLNTKIMQSSRE